MYETIREYPHYVKIPSLIAKVSENFLFVYIGFFFFWWLLVSSLLCCLWINFIFKYFMVVIYLPAYP